MSSPVQVQHILRVCFGNNFGDFKLGSVVIDGRENKVELVCGLLSPRNRVFHFSVTPHQNQIIVSKCDLQRKTVLYVRCP